MKNIIVIAIGFFVQTAVFSQTCVEQYNASNLSRELFNKISKEKNTETAEFTKYWSYVFTITKYDYGFSIYPKQFIKKSGQKMFLAGGVAKKDFFESNVNWEVEYSFEIESSRNAFYGLILGGGGQDLVVGLSKDRHYFVTMASQDNVSKIARGERSEDIKLLPDEIPSATVCKITLRRCGNTYLVFINEHLVFNDELNLVAPNASVYFNEQSNIILRSIVVSKLKISEDKRMASNTQTNVKRVYVKAEVDENIPVITSFNPQRYALIIGNEDYSNYQRDKNAEINVDFAENDARIFKEYCIKTLGIPERQTVLLINATAGQINEAVGRISNNVKAESGKAEVIFYYAGHGLPDPKSAEPYIIPVDISGANLSLAIRLDDVYKSLTENNPARVTCIIDACFSGGQNREAQLLASRLVKIAPRLDGLTGNSIVFTSCSGSESSWGFSEKNHGYLTYFLLKKLQDTKGECTYQALASYLVNEVKRESAISSNLQTPQVNYSSSIAGVWGGWKF